MWTEIDQRHIKTFPSSRHMMILHRKVFRAKAFAKILVLYKNNQMFLWIILSYIDSCWGPFLSKVILNDVPISL